MPKITLKFGTSVEGTFKDFIASRKSKGLADKTINSYEGQFRAIARFLDVTQDITSLQKSDLDKMIAGMRDSSLAPNTIAS